MLESQKHVFWQALLITIIIFSLGLIAGFILENWRVSQVNEILQKSEINLMDIRLQSDIYSSGYFDCNSAIQENVNFADKVYEESKQLDKYDKSAVLTEDLKLVHKKYDILRAMLLLNSIKIKEKCNANYSNVVYFYKYNNLDTETLALENVFSNFLTQLKENKGNKILLIPIAADNNISSVNLILDKYNILQEDLPIILIDGKIKITQLETTNDLEKYF